MQNILINLENKSGENREHLQRMKRTAAEFGDYIDLKIDAYDVMRNKNIYKNKMTKKAAIRELKSCSGTQFDPELTDKFIDFIF
ncbi:hypothetical protein [Halanaerobium saccharolyticum]|uniref:hypothetical protein n=1 Tax=Halanaerobium saccharolyticum TaxID=43595 RepID=UPI00106394FA|nr:hypothetical protein [Halanaerobium saccharolyticum]